MNTRGSTEVIVASIGLASGALTSLAGGGEPLM